jgi:dTMP kinase
MFFVFEGIDGSGKSTQARMLEAHLRGTRGLDVLLVREPGGTPLGEKVRSILLDGPEDLAPETELFLFMAARSHLARTRILPALARATVVISDRFLWSSAVYQGIAAGRDPGVALRLGRIAAPGLKITRTFLIDIDPSVAFGRVSSPNRMEGRGLEFQKRVRRGFLDLARDHGKAFAVVDGRGSPEEVHARVVAKLPRKGWPRCSCR